MKRHFAALMAACLLLAGCQDKASHPNGGASPLLFEVASADGAVEGWLFGTIHSLPDDTEWRTPLLDQTIERADSLIVEIAALDDSAALFATYRKLAMTPNQPDIATKVPPSKIPALYDLMDKAGYSPRDFHALETWAVALSLAQVYETGDPENGADLAMIKAFSGRPIEEFEGAERQLAIFDTLPEREQSDLLVAVIDEADQRSGEPEKLQRAWLHGDMVALEAATREGMMADPELREALLAKRNREWSAQLDTILERSERPLVAVGAGHLVGKDGLPTLLERRGYKVTRIQ
ncbi:TraB/GumN family protein [Altererythrobacter arenosus]|uniref:TraB/GumN family protein n=1 Tax=Altererythrobacter arenosus TaxID=3032592 RepID=A0ABY8FPR1_9SPHN|nr:TraB/GumN family protein [Altererythrobacter sp. CAU 1644]WFL77004.1 TraB/GumN family protein [Altererythrobacter sp. CAU 1644]